MKKGNIVTIGGKGGVGKTSISALLVKLLLESKKKLLLIDADPAVSVTYAVGADAPRTIGDFREDLIRDPAEARAITKEPTKELIRNLLVRSNNGLDLLVMGRGEGKGCFCGVNELLRFGIESLCGEYPLTLIDCEAGIEQVNRRAVHRIDNLILITDTSRRGMETATQILDIARKMNEGNQLSVHLVVNRVRNEEDKISAAELAGEFGLTISGFVPEDPNVLRDNARGTPLVNLPDESASLMALRSVLSGTISLI